MADSPRLGKQLTGQRAVSVSPLAALAVWSCSKGNAKVYLAYIIFARGDPVKSELSLISAWARALDWFPCTFRRPQRW